MIDPTTAAALATGAATTLVNLMTTDAWEQVKKRFCAIWSRGDAERETAVRLDREHAVLIADDDRVTGASLTERWTVRIADALESGAVDAEDVEHFIRVFGEMTPQQSTGIAVQARDHSVVNIQGSGQQTNYFGTGPAPRRD